MKKSFTLVEVMIIICIIALLAIIVIPHLLRSKLSNQESIAVQALRTIADAQIQYRATNPTYATLSQLGNANPPYIDSTLGCSNPPCIKQGYKFTVTPRADNKFYAEAVPVKGKTHCFYIDEDGVLYRSTNAACAAGIGAHKEGAPAGYIEVQ
ncbi:MAG: hypothetical protein GF375_07610 [Candidatus Omnitrophica bacterium]|nr:hypothetical protein [Candidatus Omnitrophota bacterium]MBD3269837.1 hypothetical protein [Candidatus Omnitrophota bacterium]